VLSVDHPRYKWAALSNTTLGTLLATVNASIVLISLPAIFKGIQLNPLEPGNVSYLLWMLMGYMLVTAVLAAITYGIQPYGVGICGASAGRTPHSVR
jgi:quinol-cytochrome oxidoreductase complex cytochrome b subunit